MRPRMSPPTPSSRCSGPPTGTTRRGPAQDLDLPDRPEHPPRPPPPGRGAAARSLGAMRDLALDAPSPEERLLWEEQVARLLDAVAELRGAGPRGDRASATAAGSTPPAVAEVLGIREAAVRTRLWRALARLRDADEGAGAVSRRTTWRTSTAGCGEIRFEPRGLARAPRSSAGGAGARAAKAAALVAGPAALGSAWPPRRLLVGLGDRLLAAAGATAARCSRGSLLPGPRRRRRRGRRAGGRGRKGTRSSGSQIYEDRDGSRATPPATRSGSTAGQRPSVTAPMRRAHAPPSSAVSTTTAAARATMRSW